MKNIIKNKYKHLKSIIKEYNSVIVALSGGVDSTLLAKLAYDILSDKALCVIGLSSSYPSREEAYALKIAKDIGISYITIETDELGIESYRENSGDRCYFCKRELYTKLIKIKDEHGFAYVLDGTNLSDIENDHRPGIRAIKELGVVKTPLLEAELYKSELRELARYLGLSNWDKPSFACLSSRVPEGTKITEGILQKIELGEDLLHSLGFRQFRLRYHDKIARIQLLEEDFVRIVDTTLRKKLIEAIESLGFLHVTLDLNPYREHS